MAMVGSWRGLRDGLMPALRLRIFPGSRLFRVVDGRERLEAGLGQQVSLK
jgi:hypothetical protein